MEGSGDQVPGVGGHPPRLPDLRVTACRSLGILLLWFGVCGDSLAASWVVAAADNVQQVVDRAQDGDIIRFRPGRYLSHLRIDKSLVLEGAPGVVLDGGGKGRVVTVLAPKVEIRNLDIRHSGTNLTMMDAGIFITGGARDVHVEGLRMDAVLFGIWIDGSSGALIHDNRIHGMQDRRSQDRGNGIHLHNVSQTRIEGNEIWGTRDGIYIETSNDNILSDNILHDLRYGIHYMFSNHNQVIRNQTSRTRTGYALMMSEHLNIRDNRSSHDSNYGILMNYINYSTIAGNIIDNVHTGRSRDTGGMVKAGVEGRGLFIYNSQANEILDNVVSSCDIGVYLTAGSEGNHIYHNSFLDNRLQVKYVSTREQEWSSGKRGNYWSDYLGWDLDGDGVGDRPYLPNDGVDRMMWQYPQAKWLLHSPAIELLHWVQRQFPLLRPAGVQDSHPLMQPGNEEAIRWLRRST